MQEWLSIYDLADLKCMYGIADVLGRFNCNTKALNQVTGEILDAIELHPDIDPVDHSDLKSWVAVKRKCRKQDGLN